MSPTPIQPGFVHIVLKYIAPPSQLTQPLPPHLLSRSLLQRHHFLQISPDNPHEYLCWPTSPLRAVELLEELPRQLDDEPAAYPVHYTSDAEQAYAHVSLSPDIGDGVRVVFEWDDTDGWKYHDLAMMPFPSGSRTAVHPDVQAPEYSHPAVPLVPAASCDPDPHGKDPNDDDDYWNAYGAEDDLAPFDHEPFLAGKDVVASSEDAYWARYSSVHGTADSTRPSPPPRPKRRLTSMDTDTGTFSPPILAHSELFYSHGDAFPVIGSLPPHSQLNGNSRWDPASPRALARLLTEVQPRVSPSPSPLHTPDEVDLQSDISSPTVGGISRSDTDGMVAGRNATSPSVDHNGMHEDEETRALREGIRGLWRLWEMGRRRRITSNAAQETADEDSKELFVRAVRDAISL